MLLPSFWLQLQSLLLLLLVIGAMDAMAQMQNENVNDVRNKRGAIVVDFGALLRNILLQSAQVSSIKANVTRTLVAATMPSSTTTTTTTTTTTPAPASPRPSRRRRPNKQFLWQPFHFSNFYNKADIQGPFDFADYEDSIAMARARMPAMSSTEPTTTTTTARSTRATMRTTTSASAMSAKRRPEQPKRRPLFGVTKANSPFNDLNLIYQYAQTDDISSNEEQFDANAATGESDAEEQTQQQRQQQRPLPNDTNETDDNDGADYDDNNNDAVRSRPNTNTATENDYGADYDGYPIKYTLQKNPVHNVATNYDVFKYATDTNYPKITKGAYNTNDFTNFEISHYDHTYDTPSYFNNPAVSDISGKPHYYF